MRLLKWVAGALLLLTLCATVAAGFWLRRVTTAAAPFREGRVQVAGLMAPVEVLRDSLGVPHIFAESLADALFAQGFVHASDRTWQLEMFRRVSEGRLSEIFGETTVATDRYLRTLGLGRAAERSLAEYSPEEVRLVEAYVSGVNAALEGWEGPLPPEFAVLRIAPGSWSLRSALAMERIMALDLAAYEETVALTRAHARVGDEAYRHLVPRYPAWGPTILDVEAPVDAEAHRRADASQPDLRGGEGISLALAEGILDPGEGRRIVESLSTVRGSNSWVVGGSRSASGKPLLANDMHLAMNHPTLWYLVGLHAPGIDVVGMSLPGAPGVVAGHSSAVAWGFTNAYVDDMDLFVERVDPQDPDRYLTATGSEPFRLRTEEISVRGREAPEVFVVRETRHGPVMSGVAGSEADSVIALQWTGEAPSTSFAALLGVLKAKRAEDVIQAFSLFGNPHQNVVFADSAGGYGYWMAGTVPLRKSGLPPILPVPGWTGEHDWSGVLGYERHPHVMNPAKGFVATANNRQSQDSTALLVSNDQWAAPYRAARITQLLAARSDHDAQSMLDIQTDVRSLASERYRPHIVAAFTEAGLSQAAARLRDWDGMMTLASVEGAWFETWMQTLATTLPQALFGRDEYFPRYAVERALDEDLPALDTLSQAAARSAFAAVGGRPWGDLHRLELDHPLAGVPVVGRLFQFGRRNLPREGGVGTVNVAGFSGSEPPFTVTHGPSQRHVVDMADPDGSGGFILPGGQSGLPDHAHSFDQLERWRSGELWLLPLARDLVEKRTVRRMVLVPGEETAIRTP